MSDVGNVGDRWIWRGPLSTKYPSLPTPTPHLPPLSTHLPAPSPHHRPLNLPAATLASQITAIPSESLETQPSAFPTPHVTDASPWSVSSPGWVWGYETVGTQSSGRLETEKALSPPFLVTPKMPFVNASLFQSITSSYTWPETFPTHTTPPVTEGSTVSIYIRNTDVYRIHASANTQVEEFELELSLPFSYFVLSVLAISLLVSLVANLLMLFTVLRGSYLRQTIFVLYLNLAASDLLASVLTVPVVMLVFLRGGGVEEERRSVAAPSVGMCSLLCAGLVLLSYVSVGSIVGICTVRWCQFCSSSKARVQERLIIRFFILFLWTSGFGVTGGLVFQHAVGNSEVRCTPFHLTQIFNDALPFSSICILLGLILVVLVNSLTVRKLSKTDTLPPRQERPVISRYLTLLPPCTAVVNSPKNYATSEQSSLNEYPKFTADDLNGGVFHDQCFSVNETKGPHPEAKSSPVPPVRRDPMEGTQSSLNEYPKFAVDDLNGGVYHGPCFSVNKTKGPHPEAKSSPVPPVRRDPMEGTQSSLNEYPKFTADDLNGGVYHGPCFNVNETKGAHPEAKSPPVPPLKSDALEGTRTETKNNSPIPHAKSDTRDASIHGTSGESLNSVSRDFSDDLPSGSCGIPSSQAPPLFPLQRLPTPPPKTDDTYEGKEKKPPVMRPIKTEPWNNAPQTDLESEHLYEVIEPSDVQEEVARPTGRTQHQEQVSGSCVLLPNAVDILYDGTPLVKQHETTLANMELRPNPDHIINTEAWKIGEATGSVGGVVVATETAEAVTRVNMAEEEKKAAGTMAEASTVTKSRPSISETPLNPQTWLPVLPDTPNSKLDGKPRRHAHRLGHRAAPQAVVESPSAGYLADLSAPTSRPGTPHHKMSRSQRAERITNLSRTRLASNENDSEDEEPKETRHSRSPTPARGRICRYKLPSQGPPGVLTDPVSENKVQLKCVRTSHCLTAMFVLAYLPFLLMQVLLRVLGGSTMLAITFAYMSLFLAVHPALYGHQSPILRNAMHKVAKRPRTSLPSLDGEPRP